MSVQYETPEIVCTLESLWWPSIGIGRSSPSIGRLPTITASSSDFRFNDLMILRIIGLYRLFQPCLIGSMYFITIRLPVYEKAIKYALSNGNLV